MKQCRLRQMLIPGIVSLVLPVAMVANVSTSETASATSAVPGEASIGGDEDNDVFAASHLAGRFELFSGSRQNAQSLVTGLRQGSKIRLSASDPNSSPANFMFTPPTTPMSYGEISRVLSLAQAQLANRGITSPTPEQLQIALMGGSFTSGEKTIGTTGVLQLRSQGMGWGQIAQALSFSARDDLQSKTAVAAQTRGSDFITTASGGLGTRH